MPQAEMEPVAKSEPVAYAKPLTNLLIGIGLPIAAVAVCAALGAALAQFFGYGDSPEVLSAAVGFGALIGLLASFYGLVELLVAYFFASGPALDRFCRAAGYLAVWLTAVGFILWLQ